VPAFLLGGTLPQTVNQVKSFSLKKKEEEEERKKIF
jgi:hypothetical protein